MKVTALHVVEGNYPTFVKLVRAGPGQAPGPGALELGGATNIAAARNHARNHARDATPPLATLRLTLA